MKRIIIELEFANTSQTPRRFHWLEWDVGLWGGFNKTTGQTLNIILKKRLLPLNIILSFLQSRF